MQDDGREVDEMWTTAISLVFFFAAPPTGKCQGGTSCSSLQLCSWMHTRYTFSLAIEHAVLKAPQPATAPLGTNATFNCTVQHALELKWRINNLDIPLDEENMWEIAASPGNDYYRRLLEQFDYHHSLSPGLGLGLQQQICQYRLCCLWRLCTSSGDLSQRSTHSVW